MQREIKFRGKRVDNGEWVYGYYVKTPKGEHRIYWQPFDEASSNTYHAVLPESVGQYTGLKDRNGKEIYDGDIVIGGGCLAPIDVRWNIKGRWSFGKSYIDFTQSTILSLQIIGNTIDNPELIKP